MSTPSPPPTSDRPPLPLGAGQRILLVDDHPVAGQVVAHCLVRLGYQPAYHSDPVTALDSFRTTPAEFELALLDYAMPALTGTELAAHLLALRPTLPVLMLSGYLTDRDRHRAIAVGVRAVLPKPLHLETLAHAVAATLALPPPDAPISLSSIR